MNETERYPQDPLHVQVPLAPPGPQHMVSMGTAWKYFWTRWTFSGRASRSEYWWAQLALTLVNCGLSFVLGFLVAAMEVDAPVSDALADLFGLIWLLATLVPGICLQVRRLHDTNHSGLWCWLTILPVIGWIVLFVLICTRSDPTANRYGPVPNTEA